MTTTFTVRPHHYHTPASGGQRTLIDSLLRRKDLTGTAYEGWTPDWSKANMATASQVLDALMGLPNKHAQVEPGYYVAADGTAVKVQPNKAGTGVYGLVFSGRSWDYAPGVARHFAGMTPMTAEEAARVGLASGRCIACCKVLGGETLTAKVAAVVGYGETCASKNGWAFPKGAAAQRALLEA